MDQPLITPDWATNLTIIFLIVDYIYLYHELYLQTDAGNIANY